MKKVTGDRDYNEREYFIKVIKPKLDEIMLDLAKHRIPIMYSAAVVNENGVTEYINDMLSENDTERDLYDNHIARHANVFNGFSTVPFDTDYSLNETYDDDIEYEED